MQVALLLVVVVCNLTIVVLGAVALRRKAPATTSLLDRRTRNRVAVSVLGDTITYVGALWEQDASGVILRGAEAHSGGGNGVPIDGELFVAAHRINVITVLGGIG